MVSQVVTFKRDRSSRSRSRSKNKNRSGENAQLLRNTQKESYYESKHSRKKGGGFANLFRKRSKSREPVDDGDDDDDDHGGNMYAPHTSRASPESPLNVTVVTGTKKAGGRTSMSTSLPSAAYPMNDALSTISELTYNMNTPNRKVGFDPTTKQTPNTTTPSTVRSATPSSLAHSESSHHGIESLGDTAASKSYYSNNDNDDMITRTMNYFDGLCAPTANHGADTVTSKDILSDGQSAPSASVGTNNETPNSIPVWGMVPSDDEDDDTFDTSAVDDSTHDLSSGLNADSVGRRSGHRRRSSGGAPGTMNTIKERSAAAQNPPMPTHENFEVILDASLMTAPKPAPQKQQQPVKAAAATNSASAPPPQEPPSKPASKKRGWFKSLKGGKSSKSSKKRNNVDRDVEEEKKEDDVAMVQKSHSNSKSRGVGKNAKSKSNDNDAINNNNKKSVSRFKSSEDKPEKEISKPKDSLAKRLSKTTGGKSAPVPSNQDAPDTLTHHQEENSGGAGRNKKADESWRQSKTNSMQTMRIIKEVDAPKEGGVASKSAVAPKSPSRGSKKSARFAETTKAAAPASPQRKTSAKIGSAISKPESKRNAAAKSDVKESKTHKNDNDEPLDEGIEIQESKPKSTSDSSDGKGKSSSGKSKKGKGWGGAFSKFRFMSRNKRSKDDSDVRYGESQKAVPPAKAAKPLWKAVVDPTTQRTYYYHRKTRETTWIKPQELLDMEANENDGAAESKKSTAGDVKSARSSRSVDVGMAASKPSTKAQAVTPTRSTTTSRRAVSESPISSRMPGTPVDDSREISVSYERDEYNTSFTTENQSTLPSSKTPYSPSPVTPDKSDILWEKKKEITRLLTAIPESSREQADKMMQDHPGEVEFQLKFLRELLEARPFDEPEMDAPMDEPKFTFNVSPPRAGNPMTKRVITGFSRTSATTRSSAKTDKTEKIKNTWRGPRPIEPISEVRSTATSITSDNRDQMLPQAYRQNADAPVQQRGRIPSRVPVVHRKRELQVEDLSDARLSTETFERNGRVIRGRADMNDALMDEDSQMDTGSQYHSEADTYGDSVSALSDHDIDFSGRKDNFEFARRRALEDAIEREDWELATALTEGMRNIESSGAGNYKQEQGEWKQSEIDKFIAQNNWDAVSSYIAKMRNKGPMADEPLSAHVAEQAQAPPASYGNQEEQGGEQEGQDQQRPVSRASVIMSPSANSPIPPEAANVMRAPTRMKESALSTEVHRAPTQAPAAQLEKRIGSRSQLQHREITSDSSWTSEDSYDT
eukprot:CAMPEP_0119555086 /NCGR_PEP_ID=MMETSP1352-20130426/7407_1 /TAXON_ID=265584 /ORGANISM="Stauroneis constricta, Strain CCMP1120" /LENGTH=1272 /DNA_ID=CAMNT_0007601797 /DNA_START=257 /DNA_END=4072 /DNA_ORIENTATION=-